MSALSRLASFARSKAEDDDEKEKDEEKKGKSKSESYDEEDTDKDDESGKKKGKAKKADDDADEDAKADDDADDEGMNEDCDKPAKKKGKAKSKSKEEEEEKKADDEDADDDAKKSKKKAYALGREHERNRIQAIIEHPASTRVSTAALAHLLFNTKMSSSEAIGYLMLAPEPPKSNADTANAARDRLASTPNPDIKPESSSGNNQPTLAQMIIAAGDKARGGK